MDMRSHLLFFFLFASISLRAQDHKANLDEAAGQLVKQFQGAENQQLLLHTDKAHYKLGSVIWFRVYLFNAVTHLPAKSARIHLDIFDEKDSLVSALLLNSASNELDGGIKTSSKWNEGPYIIKVYTEEMMLSPSANKPLVQSVFLFRNNGSATQPKSLALASQPGMGFFPEGGSLINGVDNVVAFRAFSDNGEPLNVSGYLKDDQDKIVETFKTAVPGYGKFSFNPSKNKKYRAFLELPDKTERSFPLPSSEPGAWQISLVRSTANSFIFRVAQGDSLYPLKPASYVAAVSNGKLVFASIGNGLYEISVSKDLFQDGPADFYLFNDKKEIVSKRQVMISRSNVQLNVIPDKTSFSSREMVNVDLDIKDAKGQPMNGIFSISVTDDRYTGAGMSFSRNEWMDITEPVNIMPLKNIPVKDSIMTIEGAMTLANGQPAAGLFANLVSTSDNLLLTDTTDIKGRYRFTVPEFYDGKTYTVQVTDKSGAKPPIAISTFPQFYAWPSTSGRWVPDTANQISAYRKADADSFLTGISMTIIQNTLVKPKATKKQAQADAPRNKSSRFITGEQLDKLGLSNTSNAVMMLPGIVMMNGKITVTGGAVGTSGDINDIEPLVVVDGVQATKTNVAEYLNAIPPMIIESIEVLTGPEAAAYGTRGSNGVILVKTSNKLRDLPFKNTSGLQYIYPQGYHQAPEFFMPSYSEPAVRYLAFTDNRSTIFWKGELVADKNGKARVSFYAADQPTTYTIHVKGITSKGDLLDKSVQVGRK